eukprot:jgi/Bigna1/70507/fgenesh1_pg.12_\
MTPLPSREPVIDPFKGLRIKVRFDEPAEWYWGTITQSQKIQREGPWRFQIAYDDGTRDEISYLKNNDAVSVDAPLLPGDLLLIEYSGEGEYLCRLIVRDEFWHVESADGRFEEEVPFDPDKDTWKRVKFSVKEKKDVVRRVSELGGSAAERVLEIVRRTSAHLRPLVSEELLQQHRQRKKQQPFRIRLSQLADLTLWEIQKFLAKLKTKAATTAKHNGEGERMNNHTVASDSELSSSVALPSTSSLVSLMKQKNKPQQQDDKNEDFETNTPGCTTPPGIDNGGDNNTGGDSKNASDKLTMEDEKGNIREVETATAYRALTKNTTTTAVAIDAASKAQKVQTRQKRHAMKTALPASSSSSSSSSHVAIPSSSSPRDTREKTDTTAAAATSFSAPEDDDDDDDEDENIFEVEAIMGKRRQKDGKLEYLVKWLNFGQEYNTWEPKMRESKREVYRSRFDGYICDERRPSRLVAVHLFLQTQQPRPKLSREIAKVWASIRSIVSQLKKHPASKAFIEPIDSNASFAREYARVIKKPMNLREISHRLEKNGPGFPRIYKAPREMFDDVCLVWRNARTFNPKGHWICEQVDVLEDAFESMWLSSQIDVRWASANNLPYPEELVDAKKKKKIRAGGVGRWRRKMEAELQLATAEVQATVMSRLEGKWLCNPRNFGYITIKGNEGIYAGGVGRLTEMKVLRDECITALWSRSDIDGARGTLRFGWVIVSGWKILEGKLDYESLSGDGMLLVWTMMEKEKKQKSKKKKKKKKKVQREPLFPVKIMRVSERGEKGGGEEGGERGLLATTNNAMGGGRQDRSSPHRQVMDEMEEEEADRQSKSK